LVKLDLDVCFWQMPTRLVPDVVKHILV
jgi:hypothetical protein